MNTSSASAGLGLLSAASWGGSDFVGGLGARRASPLLITVSGQAVSLVVLAAVCFTLHVPLPPARALALTGIAGFEAALALALFYHALSLGAMGLTAALTGLMTALVPVLFSMLHYGVPAPVTIAGLAAGCLAIWLITHQNVKGAKATPASAMLLGVLAGAGFGTQLILFKIAEPASVGAGSILAMMTVTRAAGVSALLLVLLATRPAATGQSFWTPGIAAGLMDTAGTLFYLGAASFGRLDTAAVICSLYPAGTILLAALVLRERPTRRQMAGIALALGAVALLSL
jgi:drug/metabolite transporter (DMT)-like permease